MQDIYTGISEIVLNDNDLAKLYETNKIVLETDILVNQYLIIKDKSNAVVEKRRFDGRHFVKIKHKNINNQYFGKVKPLNIEQEIMMDLIQNNNITIKSLIGVPGGGKTYIPVAQGINDVLNGTYQKLVFIKNNVDISHKELGALPGNLNDKLSVWEYSLVDSFGDRLLVDKLKNENKMEVVHIGYTLGRTFNNCFVIVDESSHLSRKHIYNLTTRLGKNSVMIFSGDIYQNYSSKYQDNNSGLHFMHENLKDQDFFGCMKVTISERSMTAQKCANLLFSGLDK